MAQLIYAILALTMIMFLSMNMQRSVGRDQQEQIVNEVATQLTSVGSGVLDQIGTRHFDWHTWNYANSLNPSGLDKQNPPAAIPESYKPYCGRIADNGEEQDKLSRPSSSNFGFCNTPTLGLECNYIEGLKGVSEPIKRGGIEYLVKVLDVRYVDPKDFSRVINDNPATLPNPDPAEDSTSFAKRVTIEVTNPFLYIGDNPDAQFSLTLERVFTYGCTTDYDDIPFIRATDPPPANQCPNPTPCARWNW